MMKKSKVFVFFVAGFLGMMGVIICSCVIMFYLGEKYQSIFDVLREFIFLLPITFVWAGIFGIIFNREYKKIIVRKKTDRQKVMKNAMIGYLLLAIVSIIAILIFINTNESVGIKLIIGVILSVLIIEAGGYLGYKNLQKDIEKINEKLKEQK